LNAESAEFAETKANHEDAKITTRFAGPVAVSSAYSAVSRLRSTPSFSSFGEARRSASGAKAAAFKRRLLRVLRGGSRVFVSS